MKNTSTYLKDNREEIITEINQEIKRVSSLFGKSFVNLRQAMIIYKDVFESTSNAGKAREAVEIAIKGNQKLSAYFFISESALSQLPSSMR